MPVSVAIPPLKLIVAVFARHTDVIIEVSNVLDVSGETHQLPLPVSVETPFLDVAIGLVDLHDFCCKAVDDGIFHDDEVGPCTFWVTRVYT